MERKKISKKEINKALSMNKGEEPNKSSQKFAMEYVNFTLSRKELETNMKKNLVQTKYIIDYLKQCVGFFAFLKKNKIQLKKDNPNLGDNHFDNVLNMLEENINWCNLNLNINEQVKLVKTGFYEYNKAKKMVR